MFGYLQVLSHDNELSLADPPFAAVSSSSTASPSVNATAAAVNGPPKAPRTAFICFADAKKEEILQRHNLTQTRGILKLVSDEWRLIDDRERAYWDEEARNDKVRYVREKAAYKGPWNLPKRRAKKDPFAPKRPMSAFLKFSQDIRPSIKKNNPAMGNTDVSRLLGEMWRNAKPEERAPYVEGELVEREQYKKKMKAFREEKVKIDAASRTSHQSVQHYMDKKYHSRKEEPIFEEPSEPYLFEPLAVHPGEPLVNADQAVFRSYRPPIEDTTNRFPFRHRSNHHIESVPSKDDPSRPPFRPYAMPPSQHDVQNSRGYRPGSHYYPPPRHAQYPSHSYQTGESQTMHSGCIIQFQSYGLPVSSNLFESVLTDGVGEIGSDAIREPTYNQQRTTSKYFDNRNNIYGYH